MLFTTGKCARFANIRDVATRKLTLLDEAIGVDDMKSPPGNDLKFYEGGWHVRVNQQWRLRFKWGDTGPHDVEICDPH